MSATCLYTNQLEEEVKKCLQTVTLTAEAENYQNHDDNDQLLLEDADDWKVPALQLSLIQFEGLQTTQICACTLFYSALIIYR